MLRNSICFRSYLLAASLAPSLRFLRALLALSFPHSQKREAECGSAKSREVEEEETETDAFDDEKLSLFCCSCSLVLPLYSLDSLSAASRSGDRRARVQRENAEFMRGAERPEAQLRKEGISLSLSLLSRLHRRRREAESSTLRTSRRRLQLTKLTLFNSLPLSPTDPSKPNDRRQADGRHRSGGGRRPGRLGRTLPPRRLRRAALVRERS